MGKAGRHPRGYSDFSMLNSAGEKQKKTGKRFLSKKEGFHGFGLRRAEAILEERGGWCKYCSREAMRSWSVRRTEDIMNSGRRRQSIMKSKDRFRFGLKFSEDYSMIEAIFYIIRCINRTCKAHTDREN